MNKPNSRHRLLFSLALLVFSLGAVQGHAADAQKTERKTCAVEPEKKFPPYPDVWGYEFPWPGEDDFRSSINVWKIESGDYIVRYVKKRLEFKRKDGSCCDSKSELGSILFFTGEKKDISFDYVDLLRSRYRTIMDDHVVFKDGSRIKNLSEDLRPRSPDPFYGYTVKTDKDGKIISKKHLFWLLERPLKRSVDRDPVDDRNWSLKSNYFIKRIENIYPRFIPLEDETFLIYDGHSNFIIRMDQDFKSKSTLMETRLFVIDRVIIAEMQEDLQKKDRYNDQTMNDAIVDHIRQLRKEGGR